MRHRLRDRANIGHSPPSRAANRPPRRGERKVRLSNKRAVAEEATLGRSRGESTSSAYSPEPEYEDTVQRLPCQDILFETAVLDECLGEGVEAAEEWWKDDERTEEAPFAALLQQLAGCVDLTVPVNHSSSHAEDRCSNEAGFCNMATSPDSSNLAASLDSSNMADHSLRRGRDSCCTGNKNALAARLNRLRKKEYVAGLENQVTRLSEENRDLQRERVVLSARVRVLEEESRYLRAVLANDSALSKILGRLTGLGGTRLSTSLFREPRVACGDHDYALPRTRQESEEEAPPGGGVCLHVDQDKVSVEFCAVCARKAYSADKIFSFRSFLALLHCRS
ncbi:CREB/ATF bZIP transcription factor isoform 1-T1 [Rhinophrynus dorsalis]